jgi:histidinol-phosphate aminotransferase
LLRPRPAINKLIPCVHGGIDYTELKRLGLSPEATLDFSVSCNPFGPPPGIREALTDASIESYPDSEASELKQALARKLGIATDNLIIGSGSTELIRLLAIVYFGSDDLIFIPHPTYGEYEIACQLVAAQPIKQPILKEPKFQLDVPKTVKLIQKHRPRGIFLCNPNNPTGQYISKAEFDSIMSSLPESLVILDEAYIAFTDNPWSSLDFINHGNLVILHSMTKDYALAGLRLGYAIAAKSIITALKHVCPPWNVNAMAQKAGTFVLNTDIYLKECSDKLHEAKEFLLNELESLGLPPLPSQTNFFLVKVSNATAFRKALLKKGILIRDCTSFGLPQYVRLAPRTLPECHRLINAIKEVGVLNHAS